MLNASDLTKRELEICGLVAEGHSNERIAKLLYLTEGTVKNYITTIFEKTGVSNRAQLAAAYVTRYAHINTDIYDLTDVDGIDESGVPILRLAGRQGLPEVIPVTAAGREFIIGRFDVNVGIKQCDFEFDKATKAVSRRHAAITRLSGGTFISDLDSRAGTFLNGSKLAPGTAYPIKNGDVVSFGGMGADYVYEEYD